MLVWSPDGNSQKLIITYGACSRSILHNLIKPEWQATLTWDVVNTTRTHHKRNTNKKVRYKKTIIDSNICGQNIVLSWLKDL